MSVVVRWGPAHIDKVDGLVFITYRILETNASVGIDAEGEQVDASQLSYSTERFDETFVTSPQVYEMIKAARPEYEPSGYLGGTIRPAAGHTDMDFGFARCSPGKDFVPKPLQLPDGCQFFHLTY